MIGVIAMVLALIILPVAIVIFILGLLKPSKRKKRLLLAASLFGGAILLATVPSAIGAFIMTSDKKEVVQESETEEKYEPPFNSLPLKIMGATNFDDVDIETDKNGNYLLKGNTLAGYKIKFKSSDIDNGKEHNLELKEDTKFSYKGTLSKDVSVIFIDVYASKPSEKTIKRPVNVFNKSTERIQIEAKEEKEDALAESKEKEEEKKQAAKEAADKKALDEQDANDYKEIVERKLSDNPAIDTLVTNYTIEDIKDTTPLIKVYVAQDIKYENEANKETLANKIGFTFFGTASATFNADGEHVPMVQLIYADDREVFAENRVIMNPKEFKVKN